MTIFLPIFVCLVKMFLLLIMIQKVSQSYPNARGVKGPNSRDVWVEVLFDGKGASVQTGGQWINSRSGDGWILQCLSTFFLQNVWPPQQRNSQTGKYQRNRKSPLETHLEKAATQNCAQRKKNNLATMWTKKLWSKALLTDVLRRKRLHLIHPGQKTQKNYYQATGKQNDSSWKSIKWCMFINCIRPYSQKLPSMPLCITNWTTTMVEPRRGGENESQQHKSSTKVWTCPRFARPVLLILPKNTQKIVFSSQKSFYNAWTELRQRKML